jgi:choline dehydrogenase-like flavoprotein
MELDARTIAEGTELAADLCIIGAGPAGITVAREFIGLDVNVVVLESGGSELDEQAQELNDGLAIGDPYAGLRSTRHRGIGGAASLWNTRVDGEAARAKYVPLDPWDMAQRPDAPYAGWPFDYTHLEPFYRRAQALCGLGAFVYGAEYWSEPQYPSLPLDGCHLTNRVYQCGLADLFTRVYPHDLRRCGNVVLCQHATVCELAGRRSDKILEAGVASTSGSRFRVRAKVFVLAAGAIENSRMLLLSDLGNRHGWVGRCFMEHPRDHGLTLVPRTPEVFEKIGFYDLHPGRDGIPIAGRIAIDERIIQSQKLPNASITLRPRAKDRRASQASLTARLMTPLRRRPTTRRPALGYGWSGVPDPSARFDAFHVLVNVEQRPHPDNKLVLARKRDRFGVPQVQLEWRWRQEEQADLNRLRVVLGSALESVGEAQIMERLRPDPNAHHHAGTTRMHIDSRWGVVDGDGRVHDTDNVYVTGGSVLPSAGFANPTLTVVALALRLADHLKPGV